MRHKNLLFSERNQCNPTTKQKLSLRHHMVDKPQDVQNATFTDKQNLNRIYLPLHCLAAGIFSGAAAVLIPNST